eukprot:TRINITY_DN22114_c0_g1_i2.p1 TRINITY_DN22114_c0_g1~~TRINITY_DN22114_c0_g1_i2.p1  ORF type:complete len:518 (+),score=80.30 TRINITY_DN22114_c0_g1_i2:112-1665(+)
MPSPPLQNRQRQARRHKSPRLARKVSGVQVALELTAAYNSSGRSPVARPVVFMTGEELMVRQTFQQNGQRASPGKGAPSANEFFEAMTELEQRTLARELTQGLLPASSAPAGSTPLSTALALDGFQAPPNSEAQDLRVPNSSKTAELKGAFLDLQSHRESSTGPFGRGFHGEVLQAAAQMRSKLFDSPSSPRLDGRLVELIQAEVKQAVAEALQGRFQEMQAVLRKELEGHTKRDTSPRQQNISPALPSAHCPPCPPPLTQRSTMLDRRLARAPLDPLPPHEEGVLLPRPSPSPRTQSGFFKHLCVGEAEGLTAMLRGQAGKVAREARWNLDRKIVRDLDAVRDDCQSFWEELQDEDLWNEVVTLHPDEPKRDAGGRATTPDSQNDDDLDLDSIDEPESAKSCGGAPDMDSSVAVESDSKHLADVDARTASRLSQRKCQGRLHDVDAPRVVDSVDIPDPAHVSRMQMGRRLSAHTKSLAESVLMEMRARQECELWVAGRLSDMQREMKAITTSLLAP